MPSATVEDYLKQILLEQEAAGGERVSTGRIAQALAVTPGTVTSMLKTLADGNLVDYEAYGGVRLTESGRRLALHVVRRHRLVELFLVPHDAREPVGVVVEDPGGARVGLVADLGCRSRLAWGRLASVHALLLEANHDIGMLRDGPYPWPLKQRVAGRHGHLSNEDAAQGDRKSVV